MPSFENFSKRSNIPNGLWNRCEVCGEITFSKELARNFKMCPKCGYHYPMSAGERIKMLTASKNFIEYKSSIKIPPTSFETLSRSKPSLTAPSELVIAGEAKLYRYQIVLCIIDSNYINSSNTQFKLDKKDYEKILYTFNQSLVKSFPLITFYADDTMITPKSEYAPPIRESERKTEGVQKATDTDETGIPQKTTATKVKATDDLVSIHPSGTQPKVRAKPISGYLPRERNEPIENIDTAKADSSTSALFSFTFLTNLATTVEKLSQNRIPHITILTNPRVGSEFSTSFPLGDIVIAEPKPALRKSNNRKNGIVTKNAASLKPPPENYLIDEYIDRKNLKKELKKILSFCIG